MFKLGDYVRYDSVSNNNLYGVIVEFEPEFEDLPKEEYGILVKIISVNELRGCDSVPIQRFCFRDLSWISKEEYEIRCVLEDFS